MIDDLFCVTLNNMTKQDAIFYCKTYGLVYRSNSNNNKGFDLAGDEDSVKTMLEDYIGRYNEIGKIMDEGWYVPDWQQDDFIDPSRSILVRKSEDSKEIKDGKECYPSCSKKKVKDEDVIYYGLFQRGGSIGQIANAGYRRYGDGILLEVYTDKEQAKEDAKRYRKSLTPGERSYYGMGYSVKPLNKSDLKNEYVKKLISDIEDKTIKDSKKVKDSFNEVPEGHKEALEEYLAWEGIIGYDEDIIDVYESKSADIDDEYREYDNSYDALNSYLEWEGILGYTEAIYDIIENGVESPYYDYMLREKFEEE